MRNSGVNVDSSIRSRAQGRLADLGPDIMGRGVEESHPGVRVPQRRLHAPQMSSSSVLTVPACSAAQG